MPQNRNHNKEISKQYKPGDQAISHRDLNNFDKRLKYLESLTVHSPLILNNEAGNPVLALEDQIPEFLFVELLEDMPAYGCAWASIVLYIPENTQDVDAHNFPSGEGPIANIGHDPVSYPKENLDEAGFVRGYRYHWNVLVYDVRGVPAWFRDRMFVYRHPLTYDGRWCNVLPNYQGDQFYGTIGYATKHELTKAKLLLNTENRYVKYVQRINTNTRVYSVSSDTPATTGGNFGDGWSVTLKRKGIYHVQATLYAIRLTQPDHSGGSGVGNQFAERVNNASAIQVKLQHKCSDSWVTLDEGNIEAQPIINASGHIQLLGKIQSCYDNDKIRVWVEFDTAKTGDWRLQNGNIHIQRCYHDHFDLGRIEALDADGASIGNIYDREGGYTEENEQLEGSYDQSWVPADGDLNKHNSGYPPDAPGQKLPFS